MDGLILSRGLVAEKPYYMAGADIYIYSLEELCYYLYNNIYLVSSDFPETGLIHFIEEELKEDILSARLKKISAAGGSIRESVLAVLRYVDYYSSSEINALQNIIDMLDGMAVWERLKARGDNFLEDGRCESALKSYAMAIGEAEKNHVQETFLGDVYHNMGAAYGRLLLYRKASEYFRRAYEYNHNGESLLQGMIAERLLDGLIPDAEGVEDELSCSVMNRIEGAMNNASVDKRCREVLGAFTDKEQGNFSSYTEKCGRMLAVIKEECLGCMR